MERTLIILKPDAVQRGLIGEIIGRLERRGLQVIGLKMLAVDRELAERHYAVHQGKGFYEGLITYIIASPVVVGVLAGANAIAITRMTIGATRPAEAAPGTIRGDLAVDVGRNLIHASDSVENGEQEVNLWFRPDELVEYQVTNQPWIRE